MIKSFVEQLLRIPSEPTPPAGSPESVRTFRASRRFYQLNVVRWGVKQLVALAVLVVVLVVEFSVDLRQATVPLRVVEGIALAVFLVQLPFGFLFIRFDYDLRWYIVTDRSLRIRQGLFNVREMTMAFSNIQQISIHQGPLQRLLGIADLEVRTAGGGGEGSHGHYGGDKAAGHLGYFRGVDNAHDIRDLILERLRQWRDAGLGDPDDARARAAALPGGNAGEPAVLVAARQVLEEARGLRAQITKGDPSSG